MKNESTGNISPDNLTDWAQVRAMKDKDIHHDADSPKTTTDDWEGAVMKVAGHEVGTVRTRGRQKSPPKVQLSLRISPDVVEFFRATGDGWQARMDDALREWVAQHKAA
jgi:uncharacterized protein (DUF4415 family)